MLRASLVKCFAGMAAMLSILHTFPAAAAEDTPKVDVRPYNYGAAVLDSHKSIRAEQHFQGIGAPVLTTIAPDDSIRSSQVMAFPERRSAAEKILQSHEFRFDTSRSRALGLKGGNTSNGIEMDAVKVRVSRNKVLIRMEFSFK